MDTGPSLWDDVESVSLERRAPTVAAAIETTAADADELFECPWCQTTISDKELRGEDDECPYCGTRLDYDGHSWSVWQPDFSKESSYAGQGVIGWGFVEKYEDRSVKSHLIIRHADGDYDTACHHKVDRNALTLSNDTPPSWDRCQACQRILDAGAEVPSPFGHITAAREITRVGQAYLGGTITSIEDDAVIVTYANGEVAKVAWDENQHKRDQKGDKSDPRYRPGEFVPKTHTDQITPEDQEAPGADAPEDAALLEAPADGSPPGESQELLPEDAAAGAPGAVPEESEGAPGPPILPPPEPTPNTGGFKTDASGVMEPPARHSPVDFDAKNRFNALSMAERDSLADAPNTIPARVAEIVPPRQATYSPDIVEAVDQRMDEVKTVMAPKIAQMVRQHVQHLGTLLQAANPSANPAAIQDLLLDACDYLAAQDAEAQSRVLGDHGARHLLTDARVSTQVVKLAGDGSPATEAMMYLCGIFHDAGYLTPPARQFLDSDHPRWSRQNYKANVQGKVAAVLGPEVAEEAAKIIVSHAMTEMDWTPQEMRASAFRLADNLGLFHSDKLPDICYLVHDNVNVLVRLAQGDLDVDGARAEMKANINQADLPPLVKQNLYAAADEVGPALPKFVLGMVGTKLGKIEWAGDHPIVHLQRTEANEALSKVLDMGQRQFLKFAETYVGEEDASKFLEQEHFAFKNRRGHLVLESRLDNPLTKDEIKAIAVNIRSRTGGWLFDKVTQPFVDYYKPIEGRDPSFDWCRFRHNSHCFLPKTLDAKATEMVGYDVWVPEDRGYCPRIKWDAQKACPVSEAGPNSGEPNAKVETWQSFEDGGQRGYASLRREAAMEIAYTEGGEVGNRTHITREDKGTLPIELVANMPGRNGEVPGEHRNKHGEVWEEFKNDIATNGLQWPIFIVVEPDGYTSIYEGNHRRDAFVEMGRTEIPATIRYFGHSEYLSPLARLADGGNIKATSSLKEMTASFEFNATWADVRAKAKRIKDAGGVKIVAAEGDLVTAYVQGDHGQYVTSIQRVPGTKQIAMWECGCPWSTYSWGRSGRWKKYEGRMCSHAQALVYEVQAQEMFGGEVAYGDPNPVTFPTPMQQPGAWRLDGVDPRPDDDEDPFDFAASRHPAATHPFYAFPPKVAMRGFLVRWRDSIHLVTDLLDNMLRLDTGEEVPSMEVTHPNYDPTIGLTASKTALADLDGCMVALVPPRSITEALAIDGGEPVEHMHITLAYMGKASDVDLDEVHNAVAEWAGRTPRLAAEVSGFGTFQNGKEPVLWAGFDVPGLERFREDLVDTLCRRGVVPANGHGFQVHMTLAYGETTMPSNDNFDPFLFESVIVADGNKWTHYPLSGNPVEPTMAETIEVDAALFEGGYVTIDEARAAGAEAMLHDEPEPALPRTDGADDDPALLEGGGVPRSAATVRRAHPGGDGGGPKQRHLATDQDSRAWLMSGGAGQASSDIAAQAKAFLSKSAVRQFSPVEQAQIISEGEHTQARNLDRLALEGTHYIGSDGAESDDDLLSWL